MLSQSFLTRWLMFCIQIIRVSLCGYSLRSIASHSLQIQFVSKLVFFSVFPVRMWLCLPHSPHYPLAEMTRKQHWLLWELGKASPFPFSPNMLFLLLPELLLACLVWICHKGLRAARTQCVIFSEICRDDFFPVAILALRNSNSMLKTLKRICDTCRNRTQHDHQANISVQPLLDWVSFM